MRLTDLSPTLRQPELGTDGVGRTTGLDSGLGLAATPARAQPGGCSGSAAGWAAAALSSFQFRRAGRRRVASCMTQKKSPSIPIQ